MPVRGLLACLKREMKTSMYFASSIMSVESISNILNELLSLVTLIAFIVFNESFGMENHIYWIWNEVWIVGRVLSQKPWLFNQVRVINVVLNQDTSLSWSQTLIVHFSCIKCEYLADQV